MAVHLAPAYCAINPSLCAAIGTALVRAAVATTGFLTGLLLSEKIKDAAEPYSETEEVDNVIQSCPGGPPPSKKDCNTAKKLLKEYRRLPGKGGGRDLDKATIARLDRLRASGDITSYDLPGGFQRIFPGTLQGKTLKEILSLCKRK